MSPGSGRAGDVNLADGVLAQGPPVVADLEVLDGEYEAPGASPPAYSLSPASNDHAHGPDAFPHHQSLPTPDGAVVSGQAGSLSFA